MGNSAGQKVIWMWALSTALVLSLSVSLKAEYVPFENPAGIFLFVAVLLGPPSLVAGIAKRICLHFFLTTGLHGEKNPWSRLGRQTALAFAELLMYLAIFFLGYVFTNGYANSDQGSMMFCFAAIGIPLASLGHWLLLRHHLNDLRLSVQILECVLLASLLPIAIIVWLTCFMH